MIVSGEDIGEICRREARCCATSGGSFRAACVRIIHIARKESSAQGILHPRKDMGNPREVEVDTMLPLQVEPLASETLCDSPR